MKKVPNLELSRLVLRTVEVYNRYRSPEATAKLLKLDEDGFAIDFEGSFCQSCGVQDYFEDFVYELKSLNNNVEAEIQEIKQTSPRSFRVSFRIKGVFPTGEPIEERFFQEFLREKRLSVEDYLMANPCTKDMMRFHFRTWLFEKKSRRSK